MARNGKKKLQYRIIFESFHCWLKSKAIKYYLFPSKATLEGGGDGILEYFHATAFENYKNH